MSFHVTFFSLFYVTLVLLHVTSVLFPVTLILFGVTLVLFTVTFVLYPPTSHLSRVYFAWKRYPGGPFATNSVVLSVGVTPSPVPLIRMNEWNSLLL